MLKTELIQAGYVLGDDAEPVQISSDEVLLLADLNRDGEIINLAIVGSSRFYDFMVFEGAVESWVEENGYPDMIIVGGASGVDYMAERWADNNNPPFAVFSEVSG